MTKRLRALIGGLALTVGLALVPLSLTAEKAGGDCQDQRCHGINCTAVYCEVCIGDSQTYCSTGLCEECDLR